MKYKLNDGSEVELKVNFRALLILRDKEPETYKKIDRVIMNGTKDVLDLLDGIYGAYVCANIADHMSYEDFMDLITFDLKKISETIGKLFNQSSKK